VAAWLRWLGGAALGLAISAQATQAVRTYPAPEIDVNMMFVPSGALLKGTASGFENVIADTLWLSLLQYYGERYFADDRTMVNLEEMFTLITDLDPRFWFAYWLGAWALSDDGQADAALRLLERGENANPQDLNYPYLQGFILFLMKRDHQAAARCFERAATKPVAEWESQRRFARAMAARMYREEGKPALALEIWRNILENASDRALAEIAKTNIRRIEAELRGGAPAPSRKQHGRTPEPLRSPHAR
jgi:tetratricopeptide (TPR) repeat protein